MTAIPPLKLIAVETRDRHDGSTTLNKKVERMKTFMVVMSIVIPQLLL
jgi:hypothetical protein